MYSALTGMLFIAKLFYKLFLCLFKLIRWCFSTWWDLCNSTMVHGSLL